MARIDRSKNPSVKGLREDIARIIDPETVNGFDKAYVEYNGYMQLQLTRPLMRAREKADQIIALMKEADAKNL